LKKVEKFSGTDGFEKTRTAEALSSSRTSTARECKAITSIFGMGGGSHPWLL
jgi:hypothetical protein